MANTFPIKTGRSLLNSKVDGFEGDCVPVWLNTNIIWTRLDGGVTGFFKRVKRILPGVYLTIGEEFHGIINHDYDGQVLSTKDDRNENI